VRFEETLPLIVESATKVVAGTSAVIYTYNQERAAFDPRPRLCGQTHDSASPAMSRDRMAWGPGPSPQRRRVLSYQEDDLDVHPVIREAAGAKVAACFPLVVADQAVGALYVFLDEDRRFSQLELLMLDNFVNQAAMAVYQTRRMASVRRNLARTEDELNRLRRAGFADLFPSAAERDAGSDPSNGNGSHQRPVWHLQTDG